MEEYLKEMTERLRRLETRFTKYMETQGFDTKVRRPHFSDGVVSIPSMACSLLEIIKTVPKNWADSDEIDVYYEDKFVVTIYLTPPE